MALQAFRISRVVKFSPSEIFPGEIVPRRTPPPVIHPNQNSHNVDPCTTLLGFSQHGTMARLLHRVHPPPPCPTLPPKGTKVRCPVVC